MLDMQYVSKKKMTLLVVLFVAVAVLAGYTELFLKPSVKSDEKKLTATKNELTKTKNDNLDIEDELQYTREKKDEFAVLKKAGFFEKQERDIVRDAVDEAMRLSGIIGGRFKVSPPVCYVNKDLKDSSYILLGSPVVVDTESYEDVSMYAFLDYLIRKLPGYLVLESLDVNRIRDVTRGVLQEIGTGKEVPLMRTNISMTWYTIVKKDSVECLGLRNR